MENLTAAQMATTQMAITAASAAYSAVSSYQSGKAQEELYAEQAKIAEREAVREAERKRIEFRRFNAQKKLNYLSRGVMLSGTPTDILRSDVNMQNEELNAIIGRGAAQSRLSNYRGSVAKSKGRASMIGSILQGTASTLSTYKEAKDAGAFDD
jgi:hypothetical protein